MNQLFLPSLTISNDQFTLTTANGHKTVHSLDSSLHRLAHRRTGDDAGRLDTDTVTLGALDSSLQQKRTIGYTATPSKRSHFVPCHQWHFPKRPRHGPAVPRPPARPRWLRFAWRCRLPWSTCRYRTPPHRRCRAPNSEPCPKNK